MDDLYCYPGTNVFINKRGIQQSSVLELYEGGVTSLRLLQLHEAPIRGDHSLQHWQKIHQHIFQDVYNWAGEIRKNFVFQEFQSPYADPALIETGYHSLVQPVLTRTNHLKTSRNPHLARDMACLMGELYYLHPFRDGNTRSLIQFSKSIAHDAGIALPIEKFSMQQWKDLQYGLVQAAHAQNPSLLENLLKFCIKRISPAIEIASPLEQQGHELKAAQEQSLSAVASYNAALKEYTSAKVNQCEHIENVLHKLVTEQQATLTKCIGQRPGRITSLWKGNAWKKQHGQEQTRLTSLLGRLARVQIIKADMRKLEQLAEAKLRTENGELAARRDEKLKVEREALFQRHERGLAQEQSIGQGKKQSRGRSHTIDR